MKGCVSCRSEFLLPRTKASSEEEEKEYPLEKRKKVLFDQINNLSPALKKIAILRFKDNLSYEDICKKTNKHSNRALTDVPLKVHDVHVSTTNYDPRRGPSSVEDSRAVGAQPEICSSSSTLRSAMT